MEEEEKNKRDAKMIDRFKPMKNEHNRNRGYQKNYALLVIQREREREKNNRKRMLTIVKFITIIISTIIIIMKK